MPSDHLPVEVAESIGTTGVPDIHSDVQEGNTFNNEGSTNRDGGGRRSPQLMWYEGEEYYEDLSDYDGPTDLVDVSMI